MANGPHILTANRLRDGAVVFWRSGAWVSALALGEVLRGDDAEAALAASQAFVARRVIVNPYLFAVRDGSEAIRPVETREVIRAAGPSVRRDLGKQAQHVPL